MDNIKAILFDVDGVLTDGKITIDNLGNESKTFHVRDGQLIEFMQSQGFLFGAISGRSSKALEFRLNELNIDFYRLGVSNKLFVFQEFLEKFGLEAEDVCYIGDDVIDIEVLKAAGLSIAPSDSIEDVLKIVNIVTNTKGGGGVLRELIDKLIENKNSLRQSFLYKFKLIK